EYVQDYIHELSERFGQAKILITGYQVLGQDLTSPANVSQISYIRDVKDLLEDFNPVFQEK
ncbi:MAG: helix-turn-helix-type transcriptional regulator, partial [Bacteroidetes bacterium]|nr:helix-turn-helix-type transcriptional regulator [Bacteroidota bacterium]